MSDQKQDLGTTPSGALGSVTTGELAAESVASMPTRSVHDPFLNKIVEVSNRLTDRLRGKYAIGPMLPNGEPEFGWNEYPSPPIQKEAADAIDILATALRDCIDSLEYVDRAHPDLRGLTGSAVRFERVAKAHAALSAAKAGGG